MGRKTLSIKKIPKENNSDFSVSQINGKLSNKLLKQKNEENHINNDKKNINQEKAQNKENVENKKIIKNEFKDIDSNMGIDVNFISNNNNNKELDNKSENIPEDLVNDIYHYNLKNNNKNNKNSNNINCNSNNSTNNNINYGNIKNDYSIDNVPEPINKITHKKEILQNDVIQNIIDLNNSNINNNLKENKINKNIKNKNKKENNENINIDNKKQNTCTIEDIKKNKNDNYKIKILDNDENNEILNNNYIKNSLFDEENLDDLPEDYDENFNDLYSIINRINFGSVLVCVEGFFTPEGKAYKRYKDKFDKFYDKSFAKKGYSFSNSNNKPKKIVEVAGLTSNTKTNSSSSKKKIVSPNVMYNDLNIVKELNVNC